MAINDIKIKSHDIYLERNGDKGGNLNIGASTTTNSLTVNTTTNNKGGLIVGTSDSPSYLDVHGVINNNGNLTVSGTITGNTLAVGSGGLTVSGNTTTETLTINSNMTNKGALTVSGSTTTESLTVNTNTINNGNLTVGTSTTQGNINIYGDISLSGSVRNISCNNDLFIRASHLKLISPNNVQNNVQINTPTLVMNANKINIERYSGSDPINIDDLLSYTPSTIPVGLNKSWSYEKECDPNSTSVCTSDRKDFAHTTDFVSVGGFMTEITYYNILISDNLSYTDVENFKKYFQGRNPTIKLYVKVADTPPLQEISLSKNAIKLDSNAKTLRIQADNKTSNSDFTNLASIAKKGYTISQDVKIKFIAKVNRTGDDAVLSIEQCSTVEINTDKHLLLSRAPAGTTNISHFQNATYSPDYHKLIITTTNSVTLSPGDFIEYYPAYRGSCYISCTELNIYSGLNVTGSQGYIYYDPNGCIYIQTQNSITPKPLESLAGKTFSFTFRSSTASNSSLCEVVIKR